MDTEDFFGQPEGTIQSQLPEPEVKLNLDQVNPSELKQPSTKYSLECGYRKELSHPAFPWHGIIEQRDDGYIRAVLSRWEKTSALPKFDVVKSGVFPFPWNIKEISDKVNDPIKAREWNDVIAQSLTLPMFIYTPTLFAMLMGTLETDGAWLKPIILSTSVLRCYSQVLSVTASNKTLDRARRTDIMKRAADDMRTRMDLMTEVIRQNSHIVALAAANPFDRTTSNEYVEVYEEAAKLFAGHTYTYIKIMEAAILRLCDLDPQEHPSLKELLVESALPDPTTGRIQPYADLLRNDWKEHNVQYTNLLYMIRKRGQAISSIEALHCDDVRGVNKEAMWHSIREMLR